jgi:hypothetical protein
LEIREGGGIDDDDGPSSGMASFDVVDGGKVERMAKGDGGGGDGVLELSQCRKCRLRCAFM